MSFGRVAATDPPAFLRLTFRTTSYPCSIDVIDYSITMLQDQALTADPYLLTLAQNSIRTPATTICDSADFERHYLIMLLRLSTLALVVALATPLSAQTLMPIDLTHSAEAGWLKKKVLDSRPLDDMQHPETWAFTGTGKLSFNAKTDSLNTPGLRVDVDMFVKEPAPTRNKLSSINLRRIVPGEDWRKYNRISMWIKPHVSGFPMLPLQIVLHNDGAEKVPDLYDREGIHYVTLREQRVAAGRLGDRAARARPGDDARDRLLGEQDARGADRPRRVRDRRLELQRVDPDHHTGWNVAPGKIAFSHTGYRPASTKTAIASDLDARQSSALPRQRLRRSRARPDQARQTRQHPTRRIPEARLLRSESAGHLRHRGRQTGRRGRSGSATTSGTARSGRRSTSSTAIGAASTCPASTASTTSTGSRRSATSSITMSGGWHDAGDLSQGVINTGEATYAMFALAETHAAPRRRSRARRRG